MPAYLPPLRLTGALCLRDGRLQQRSIALAQGRFTTGPYPAIDLPGYYVLPGMVDLHSAGFRQNLDSTGNGLPRIDREAAAHGVTTRSLAVPWSWEREGVAPEAAIDFARRLSAHRTEALTDLHLQIACEALMTDAQDALLDLVKGNCVRQVIFSNRALQIRDLRASDPEAFQRWAWANGGTADSLSAALDAVLPNAPSVPRGLCRLAEVFDAAGILYGSDGDATAEVREHHSMIGARLCLNPGTARVAAAARAVGDPVLACADDVLHPAAGRPGPRVAALVQAGLCDALVSGHHGASLVPAVFRLVEQGVLPLERAWRLVSELPARIARLPDRGVIAPGKRADVTIVNAKSRLVEATIAGGRLSYLAGEAAQRFLRLDTLDGLAAE
jgi:alpha-D-ribose 1-methylphosphonate 5-triphosphate diphosphatase